MLGVQWSTEVGEDFTETLRLISEKEPPSESSMFHGTIDLIGSSDDDYESDLTKSEEVTVQNDVTTECDLILQVEDDVKNVVSDIIDFVERNTLFPEIGFDPDGMGKPEDIVLREGSCMKPHCQLGCLCSSLRGAFQHVPTHCSKERCMFECHCQERGLSAIDDERHYADKSKRKKKIPNRFKDVVLGRAYKKLHARTIHDASDPDSESDSDYESTLLRAYKKTSPISSPPKVPSPEPKKDGNGLVQTKVDNSWIHSDKIANIKRTIQERRVGFVANTMSEDQTLADVNIWCSQHNKYSCLCINYVYYSKTNYLLWKPSNKSRYLANKVMFEILLKEPCRDETPYEVFPYNRLNHCARTHGALLDYNVRNHDEIFTTKRKLELEHNVLSYSNSYVKFRNFVLVKASHPVPSAEPYNKHGRKRSMGKVVNIVKTTEKVKVDVGEENLDVRVNYQLDDGNSEEEEEEQKTKVSGRKRKLTQKMKELEEQRKREREAEMEDMKKIEEEIRLRKAMEELPAKVPKKRGRPPKPKPGADLITAGKADMGGPSDGRPIREPTPEVELVPRKKNGLKFAVREDKNEVGVKLEPASPDYFSAESRTDMETNEDIHAPMAPAERDLYRDRTSTKPRRKVSSKAPKDCLDEFCQTPKPFLGFSDVHQMASAERDLDTDRTSATHPPKSSSKAPKDCLDEFCQTPKPFLGFSDIHPMASAEPDLNTDRTSATHPPKSSSKALKDCLDEFCQTPKPFLGFSDIHPMASAERVLNTDRGSATRPPKARSKALKDCLDEFRDETPKPFLGFSDCDDNSELEDCDSDFIDSIHSKKVLVLSPRSDGYPHLGLMCLTPGIGYLSVTESLRGRVVIVDPIDPTERHTFNNIRNANDWLNRFFRSKATFSSPDLVLQWILVTPGILKLKQSKPFNPEVFQDPHMVITRNGPVRFAPSHRKNLNVANNCSLLRKQLSEHSVFRPLIRKQLAMRETNEVDGSLHNPKFSIGSKWVPNPKFGKKKLENKLLPFFEQRFQSSDSLVSLQRVQNICSDTSVGCVQSTSAFQPSQDIESRSPLPQLTSDAATGHLVSLQRVQNVPSDTSVGCVRMPAFESSRNTKCRSPPQLTSSSPFESSTHATLRPLPSLTKILSNKLAAKLSREKGLLN